MYSQVEREKRNNERKWVKNSIYFSDKTSENETEKEKEIQHFPYNECVCIYKINLIKKVNIVYVKMSITLKYFNEAIIFDEIKGCD